MSLSLRRLLLLTLLTLTLGGTIAVGIISYRAARDALTREAVRLTGLVAENRRQSLLRTLTRQRLRIERFAAIVATRCGAMPDAQAIDDCYHRSADSIRDFEGAAAARLTRPHAGPIFVGDWHHEGGIPPDQVVGIHRDEDGHAAYVTTAAKGGVGLAVEIPITNIQHIFADRTGLGQHGETFLVDANGAPLTPMLDPEAAARHVLTEPRLACLAGSSGERLASDYRGLDVVHGFRFMPELGGGCVMAQVSQADAFAPAAALGRRLAIIIAIIGLVGTLLSILIADRIAAPIRRLQGSARRLQAGDFETRLSPTGPSEVRDLTNAFAAMTRSLRESHDSLAAANRLKDEFLATLSHELRTPLNAILGWASVLRAKPLEPLRTTHGLEIIERNAKAQVELISDLLDMSRIITGNLRLQRRRIDLAEVARAAMDTVRPAAEAKGLALNTQIASLVVNADPARLQQVLWNLLSNAVKFTPAGGKISVMLTRRGSDAEIVVEDTGPGVPDDFIPHAFEPFRQADSGPTRTHGGLGLGLAIVRHLVELHGGRIRIERAASGNGARFIVELPAPFVEEEVAPIAVDLAASGSRSIDGLRVLVVEDHADTRELIATVLEEHGARVTAAASAREAFAAFEAETPHVLIADIGLPDEDGYGLIRRIRALDRARGGGVPAVALTAYVRADDRTQAIAAGFTTHLGKPVSGPELVEAVAAVAHSDAVG